MGFSQVRRVLGAFGVAAAVALLAAIVAVVLVLAFSVTIEGTSMEPTLREGDRVQLDVLHRDRVERFDIVAVDAPREAGGGGRVIVKRVIGTPGDRVAISGGPHPVVLVRPNGEEQAYVVVNPAWGDLAAAAVGVCCESSGRDVRSGRLVAGWAEVPEDSYWLLGDNWGASTDSRAFGFVNAQDVDMRLGIRVSPLDRFGEIRQDLSLTPVDTAAEITLDR